jgi:hypothetical protein
MLQDWMKAGPEPRKRITSQHIAARLDDFQVHSGLLEVLAQFFAKLQPGSRKPRFHSRQA